MEYRKKNLKQKKNLAPIMIEALTSNEELKKNLDFFQQLRKLG